MARSKESHDDGKNTNAGASNPEKVTADSVYSFYVENLFPAIWASLPLLFSRIGRDVQTLVLTGWSKTVKFLMPWTQEGHEWSAPSLVTLWEQAVQSSSNSTIHEFMLRHFDTNGDGYISASELVNMTEIMSSLRNPHPESWLAWWSRAWPLMDWKIGVFIWRYFGGMLFLVMIASIVPGRLHGYSGRILRWVILALTYFMIMVELAVYVIIRLFIKLAESLFASPKHRKLRRQIAKAKSYEEWYALAKELDVSQNRAAWQSDLDDDTSYRYNWSFIKELINDMRTARANRDSLLALAVLQQCTRKNVGGVMSEELFSYTNTGETKYIVQEFVEEVAITLRWVTEEAIRTSGPVETYDLPWSVETAAEEKQEYEKRLQRKVMQEKSKMWSSLISWANPRRKTPTSMRHVSSAGAISNGKKSARDNKTPKKRDMKMKSTPSNGGGSTGDDANQGMPNVNSTGAMSSASGAISDDEDHVFGAGTSVSVDSNPNMPAFHREHVISFLKRARSAYGRSALCLSGGSMMGNYHFGIVEALLETDALPNIISGTSAGSVVATIVCTRTPEEIERDMRPEILATKLQCFSRPWPDRIRSLIRNGHLFEYDQWFEMIQWMTCGLTTFEEAYQKTGRTFCITLSATTKKAPPVLLNHISAPNVIIASAIIASAAVPFLVPPVRLQVKDRNGNVVSQGATKDELYWDGSIEQDIPIAGLSEMLNCHFFVAAQCNPHIVPFFFDSKGDVGRPSRWSSGRRADSWRGGFLLSALELYLKSDMRAKQHFLNDVEAAVGWTSTLYTQIYGGTTTIVPQVSLIDYLRLFVNPSLKDLLRYFQGGSIAAYQHVAMIKLHYVISDTLDDCLGMLENKVDNHPNQMARTTLLRDKIKTLKELDGGNKRRLTLPANLRLNTKKSHSDSETSASLEDVTG